MDIFTTFDIAASGLKAQTTRLNTISSNLANAETTSTPEGGPYKKKSVVFQTEKLPFRQHLDASLHNQGQTQGVKIAKSPKTPVRRNASTTPRIRMPRRTAMWSCPTSAWSKK
jgi:flagellar basal-body rod protein FlgC